MTTSISFIDDKLVPVEAIQRHAAGSYEHLSLRIDEAIQDARSTIVGNSDCRVARIATFPSHVFVGTDDGRYFRVRYENVNEGIHIHEAEQLDVPVVDKGALPDYVSRFALGVVDAILSGEGAKERVLDLYALKEAAESIYEDDLATIVDRLIKAARPWRRIFGEQKEAIRSQIADVFESISAQRVERKYFPLYDGTIPEEKFGSYKNSVASDLTAVANRLEHVQKRAEGTYLPFVEALVKLPRTDEEQEVLGQFTTFADDYLEDLQVLRDHVAFALKNEGCVMCLGQIHDALAEAITDYEIAGAFIERMAGRFNEAA